MGLEEVKKQIAKVFEDHDDIHKDIMSKHFGYKFDGQAIAYLKQDTSEGFVTVGFSKLYNHDNQFSFDSKSKYMRHKYYKNFDENVKQELEILIEESIVSVFELEEQKRIKASLRKR
jgi:hypothetical protein